MRRYLVTGGCGFIGGHLVRALLARGDEVDVLDDLSTGRRAGLDPWAQLRVGDVADEAEVAAAARGCDGIFHLAAIASVPRCLAEPERARAVNLGGARNALLAARRPGGAPLPVVLASSAAVYGDAPGVVREESETRPISGYGADKLAGERVAAAAAGDGAARATALRFFNVYGPGQDPASPYSGVVSIFADRLARDEPVTINGDGAQRRDFVYVADVVAHLLAAMRRLEKARAPRFDAFNVCTGRAVTLHQLLDAMARRAGREPRVLRAPARPGDIRVSAGDPSAARRALGVVAATGLEQGLAALPGVGAGA